MANLSVGIVGLPNVGKSTLFNALLKKQAALVANYPFATIEPNIGVVPVPDERLERLAEITAREIASPSARNDSLVLPPIVPATVEFVDIAGLVKGASEGEGLGNKFLSHIREVKIIAHVVRVFEDSNVIKEGAVDPKSDYETIRYELMLADLQSLENQESRIKNQEEKKAVENIIEKLKSGKRISELDYGKQGEFVKSLNLLSQKEEIIVLNVTEADYNEEKINDVIRKYSELIFPVTASETKSSAAVSEIASPLARNDINFVVISAKIEEELASLSPEEAKEYLAELGVDESGLERLIKKSYELLGLISFLTAGEKSSFAKASEGRGEVRAWTVQNGTKAVDASGVIHTDFMKKFIKAEVVSYDDFVNLGGLAPRSLGEVGWKGAREAGKARLEGRDYIVQDGDVVEFKIGR